MNKPQPTTRLAVEKYTQNVIGIVCLDDESRDWVRKEASAYGVLFGLDLQKILLYPDKRHNIDEVVAFLRAGPAGEGTMGKFGMLVTNNALHLHGESILAPLAAEKEQWKIRMEDVMWADPAPAKTDALVALIFDDTSQPPTEEEDGVILDRANTLRENAKMLIEFFGKDRADEMAMEIKAILYPYGQ